MSYVTAQYVGRCKRHGCGMALWTASGMTFGISAGTAKFRCGRFKTHKTG